MRFLRHLALLLLLPVAATAAERDPGVAPSRFDGVRVETRRDGTVIHLRTSGATTYRAKLIDGPPRLVVDLEHTVFAWREGRLDVTTPPLRRIRGSQFTKDVSRVVVELTERAPYVVTDEPDGIRIDVKTSRHADRGTPLVAPIAVGPATPRAEGAVPPVMVAQAQPAAPAPAAPRDRRLISLDFKDADVVNLLRILAAESGKNIIIGDDVKGKMSITLKNVPWDQALDIILESRGLVKIEKGNVIRIITQDQLEKEREAAAKLEQARVQAEDAKAKADAEIRTKAAEAALKEQEVEQRKLAAEQAAAEQAARGPLVEETIRLAYADPEDVAKTLQGILGIPPEGMAAAAPAGPVVPPAGPPFSALYGKPSTAAPPPMPAPEVLAKGITIRAHKPTNSIFIRDYQKDVERIKKLIREDLDVPLPQVKIEARLTELKRSDLFGIGIAWGGAGVGRDFRNVLTVQGVNPGSGVQGDAIAPPPPPSGIPLANAVSPEPFDSSVMNRVPLTGFLPVSGLSGLPLGGNVVNLPLAAGSAPTAALGFGIIGTRFNINLALQALDATNKSHSLARPEIVTVDNAKASISLGTDVPYATVSSAGTQIQFKEASLKLEVTPTVIHEADGTTKIKMKVIITNDQVAGTVPSGSAGGTLPLISKQLAQTEVVVKEGETLVIGGIGKRNDSEGVQKVPLFGDIPILGWLFKAKNTDTEQDELVVFLTPTVIRDSSQSAGAPTSPLIR